MHPDRDERRESHYFDDDPNVRSDPLVIDVTLPDTAFAMETDRGVFSRGHLDLGTSLLLRSSVLLANEGDLLDLGCGAGPIAMTMARRSPRATIWAIDVNERARDLCTRNADRNGIKNIQVVSPNDVPEHVRFRSIWSNPPIRIGKQPLHDLLAKWFDRLLPDGTALIVVQKHLGADSLQRWLIESGFPTRRIASKSGYRVLSSAAQTSGGTP